MSKMSQLAFELQEAQEEAWEAAMILEQKLGAISNILWQNGEDAAVFRAPDNLLEMLSTIQSELAVPISEIEGAV